MVPRPPLPKRGRAKNETFHWRVKPTSSPVVGRVYLDGSLRDGIAPELGKEGWGFAILDDEGEVLAAAYGIPPPWLHGIEGAEAWGLYQSLLITIPQQCTYWPDCLPVVRAMWKGAAVAADPKNPLARVHGMMHAVLDEEDLERIGCMPSHHTDKELGVAERSDGN